MFVSHTNYAESFPNQIRSDSDLIMRGTLRTRGCQLGGFAFAINVNLAVCSFQGLVYDLICIRLLLKR